MNDDLSHEKVSVNDDDVKSLKSVSDGVPELDQEIHVDLDLDRAAK